ncbi:MAG: hypothetical protein HUJ77_11235 [Clostridium sp.]|uniref:hypothetical protein n=1 Tax=Clostridium sp. TaxID=1506 RepID=UPI0025BBB0DF|nr:hypothetical protein [Clostridium sp.]MCF0148955.1 hypothetical protein [Clostridium sp.]
MKIIFNEETKLALLEVLKNSSNNNIRIKVLAVGCGKPAYDLYADYVSEEDLEFRINEVNFVIAKKDEKICDGIEIKYDKDIYNNGFYVRSL